MALTTSYLTSTKNFEGIMNSILDARAPENLRISSLRIWDIKVAMIG